MADEQEVHRYLVCGIQRSDCSIFNIDHEELPWGVVFETHNTGFVQICRVNSVFVFTCLVPSRIVCGCFADFRGRMS